MFKKMILIDPVMYKPTLGDKKLCLLDQEISDVLNSDLPDDEKAKRYLIALKGYRHLEHPPKITPDETESILKSVKPELRINAKRLLKHIKPHIRWSDDGQLVHDSALVSDSSAVELLNEASSAQNSINEPIGWEEFSEDIKRADTPKSFITNTKLKQFVLSKRSHRRRGGYTPKKSTQRITWES
jgi:hypothetical protein